MNVGEISSVHWLEFSICQHIFLRLSFFMVSKLLRSITTEDDMSIGGVRRELEQVAG